MLIYDYADIGKYISRTHIDCIYEDKTPNTCRDQNIGRYTYIKPTYTQSFMHTTLFRNSKNFTFKHP